MKTAADQAELDVLLHGLTKSYSEHRATCEACEPCRWPDLWDNHKNACTVCQGHAPLTFCTHCAARVGFRKHFRECPSCNPCPDLKTAIAEVLDWREARSLLSQAQALRIAQDLEDAA